jgi:hypothetical protein
MLSKMDTTANTTEVRVSPLEHEAMDFAIPSIGLDGDGISEILF